MKITFLGHASLLIETKGTRIVVDPFITPNPKAANIDIESLRPDVLLLTHAHGDHVADVETLAAGKEVLIVSNFEITTYFGQKNCKGHGMNIGGKFTFDWGTVKMVNALHSSAFPDGTYGGNPAGFVLWNEEGCVYIAGDTALTKDMELIAESCPSLDLAILPIGDNFTMGYEDAVHASDYVGCDRVLGYHFDTFEVIAIDKAKAKEVFGSAGKELVLLGVGESLEV